MTLVRRATACTGDRLVRSSVGRVSACAPPSSLGGAGLELGEDDFAGRCRDDSPLGGEPIHDE